MQGYAQKNTNNNISNDQEQIKQDILACWNQYNEAKQISPVKPQIRQTDKDFAIGTVNLIKNKKIRKKVTQSNDKVANEGNIGDVKVVVMANKARIEKAIKQSIQHFQANVIGEEVMFITNPDEKRHRKVEDQQSGEIITYQIKLEGNSLMNVLDIKSYDDMNADEQLEYQNSVPVYVKNVNNIINKCEQCLHCGGDNGRDVFRLGKNYKANNKHFSRIAYVCTVTDIKQLLKKKPALFIPYVDVLANALIMGNLDAKLDNVWVAKDKDGKEILIPIDNDFQDLTQTNIANIGILYFFLIESICPEVVEEVMNERLKQYAEQTDWNRMIASFNLSRKANQYNNKKPIEEVMYSNMLQVTNALGLDNNKQTQQLLQTIREKITKAQEHLKDSNAHENVILQQACKIEDLKTEIHQMMQSKTVDKLPRQCKTDAKKFYKFYNQNKKQIDDLDLLEKFVKVCHSAIVQCTQQQLADKQEKFSQLEEIMMQSPLTAKTNQEALNLQVNKYLGTLQQDTKSRSAMVVLSVLSNRVQKSSLQQIIGGNMNGIQQYTNGSGLLISILSNSIVRKMLALFSKDWAQANESIQIIFKSCQSLENYQKWQNQVKRDNGTKHIKTIAVHC